MTDSKEKAWPNQYFWGAKIQLHVQVVHPGQRSFGVRLLAQKNG